MSDPRSDLVELSAALAAYAKLIAETPSAEQGVLRLAEQRAEAALAIIRRLMVANDRGRRSVSAPPYMKLYSGGRACS